jgi:hypothetical protein
VIMNNNFVTISVRGKPSHVPCIAIDGVEILTRGRRLKIASIRDEEYCLGDPIGNPEQLIERFRSLGGVADIFTFSQRITDTRRNFDFPVYWDNAAVIPTKSYSDWWDNLAQVARRNVRLAAKRGLIVSAVPFDDELVRGITGIYNETPVRQGRRFWHYGKSLEQVRRDNATFLERSEFIAAHIGSELIGFIKMVYVDQVASIMQILSKTAHQDKRPTNALIAKAVEICAERSLSYLRYCNFVYHGNYDDALTDFKRRNGFQELHFPQYFVPLTLKGRIAVALKIPLGPSALLPKPIVHGLLKARSRYYEFLERSSSVSAGVAQS